MISVSAVPALAAHAANLFSATFCAADIYIKGKRLTQRDEKPTPAAQDAKLQTSSPKSTAQRSLITADYSMPLSTHRPFTAVTLTRRDVNVCKSTLLTDSLKMRNR